MARGWTAVDLAARCSTIGAPEITPSVIANIETGRREKDGRRRREITVDELLILAYALRVPPVFLFLPVEFDERLRVSREVVLQQTQAAPWVVGDDTVAFYEIFPSAATPGIAVDAPEFKEWAHWRRSAMPVRFTREIWGLTSKFDRLLRDGADNRQLEEVIVEIATIVEWFGNRGLTPPALPRSVVEALNEGTYGRTIDWTFYPGELHILSGDE